MSKKNEKLKMLHMAMSLQIIYIYISLTYRSKYTFLSTLQPVQKAANTWVRRWLKAGGSRGKAWRGGGIRRTAGSAWLTPGLPGLAPPADRRIDPTWQGRSSETTGRVAGC